MIVLNTGPCKSLVTRCGQCFCFQILIQCFFGYFHPEKFFLIMKITKFRGDLTDISVKKGGTADRGQRFWLSQYFGQDVSVILVYAIAMSLSM